MSNRIHIQCEEGLTEPSWIGRVEPYLSRVLDRLDIQKWELSILFCTDAYMANLNSTYRHVDGPTDVLSFEQGDEYIDDLDETWFNAGDIVISLDAIPRNARDFSVSENEELKRLLLHGILHLDGMDHSDNSPDQEMLQFQEHFLAGFQDVQVYEG